MPRLKMIHAGLKQWKMKLLHWKQTILRKIVELPLGERPISSKWVYRIKFKADGTIDKFKVCFVARGFDQVKGKDYKHTFSPVAKLPTVRVLMALAATKGWPLHQLDINNAFLHGYIDEEVYILPPEGYANCPPSKVCKLKRSLYGLKQASRQWNTEFTKFLIQLGFVQSKRNYSLFTKRNKGRFIAALVYVDDVLITGDDAPGISALKQVLNEAFTIKDLGLARYFLGLEICRSDKGIIISQRKYIMDILANMGLTACNPTSFPPPTNLRLSTDQGSVLPNPESYKRLIGRLLYLHLSRHDVSYAIQHLSQFGTQPRMPDTEAAIHVMKYLEGTINKGLFYSASCDLFLTAYSDADWG